MNIELMAPAGSIESFFTAIQNGADSVYLGLQKFNARKPAENFSPPKLKQIIDIAHGQNKKIYLTLNIDLKSNELKDACKILEFLKEIKIDGVIVKDPAIIYIINKFYKNIDIHLSTQNAICSSYGILFTEKIGAKRTVLAREITIEELILISNKVSMELEIFTEGSMCFSVSGRCLMSSWVGARSGNRGICTAPCRVLWENNNKMSNYFSMKDLSLINHLDDIKKANVSALKIEGRLKKPEWVKAVTSFYRKALDEIDSDNTETLYNELKKYSAREIYSGHFYNHTDLIGKNENWENYKKIIRTQIIEKHNISNENIIHIKPEEKKIDVQITFYNKKIDFNIALPPKPRKAKPVSINTILEYLTNYKSVKDYNFQLKINDLQLNTSSSFIQKLFKEITKQLNKIISDVEKLPELNEDIINFIQPENIERIRDKKLGEIPDKIIIDEKYSKELLDLNLLFNTVVIPLERNSNIELLNELKKKYELILSIPPVLFEQEANDFFELVKLLNKNGFKYFEANSFTGIEIIKNINCHKYLGYEMGVMNHLAAKFFYNQGFYSVYSSIESDKSIYKSLSNFTNGRIEAMVFGKIKVFQSRVDSEFFKENEKFKDKFNISVRCHKMNDLYAFVTDMPFNLIRDNIKRDNILFDSLTADLRFFKKPLKILKKIYNNYDEDSSLFNFFKKLV